MLKVPDFGQVSAPRPGPPKSVQITDFWVLMALFLKRTL